MSILRTAFLKSKHVIKSNALENTLKVYTNPFTEKIQKRYSRYITNPDVGDPSKYTDFEVTSNPDEWKYVERLLPKKFIPVPKPKEEYPSGWIPQKANPHNRPYFVERTKNHMLPAYLKISHRGIKKNTVIRRIEGDIWAFNEDLLKYLKHVEKKPIGTQVDEVCGKIEMLGDHVHHVNQFLLSKGL